MAIGQGDVYWASLEDPLGPGPGSHRPVVVVQGDDFNASRIATTVVVPLTSNLRLAPAPGNVMPDAARTGLPQDSVANLSQILNIDRAILEDRVGRLVNSHLLLVLSGIDLVLGRKTDDSGRVATMLIVAHPLKDRTKSGLANPAEESAVEKCITRGVDTSRSPDPTRSPLRSRRKGIDR